MKLITKNTDYAIRALIHLARADRLVCAKELAKNENIPYQFLRRILNILQEKGFIVSKEGIGGGFKLQAKPDSISLSDVMGVFQGRVSFNECMFRKKLCANRPTCVLRARISRIEEKVSREFESLTIAGLVKDLEDK